MSSTEVIERLTCQLQEALTIVREQAVLLALHGVEELPRETDTPTLAERREAALQCGQRAAECANDWREYI